MVNSTNSSLRLVSSSPSAEAWKLHVVGLPAMPGGWAEWAERFVDDLKPSNSAPVLAVLLLCLDNAKGWDDFVRGGWLTLCTAHRYLYFDGRGYGDHRTLRLAEKFIEWLDAQGELRREELRWLLEKVDDARQASGIPRVRGEGRRDRVFFQSHLPDLSERFTAGLEDGLVRDLAPSAFRVLAVHTSSGPWHTRFGSLDVDRFVASALEPGGETEPREVLGAANTLLTFTAQFYRWLAREQYLDETFAEEVAQRLDRAALGLVGPSRVC